MRQLVVDIGNTRTKLGLFEAQQLVERLVWTDWRSETLAAYARANEVQRVLLCSVAAPDPAILTQLQAHTEAFELTADTPLPFRNAYRTPQTLGKDRLAAVAGAQTLFPGANCVVIDCGTCIKYEWLTADGVYHGGNIAPGARMRLKAMHHFTARLPEAPMEWPEDAIVGYSTASALQIGALYGAVLEMEGFVRAFRQSAAAATTQVILTGGDAPFFMPRLQALLHTPHETAAPLRLTEETDLTLYGLNHILLNL